jgi:hypothetical protein
VKRLVGIELSLDKTMLQVAEGTVTKVIIAAPPDGELSAG